MASFCRCKPLLHGLRQEPLYELWGCAGGLPLFEDTDGNSPRWPRGLTKQGNNVLQRSLHLGWLRIEPHQCVQNTRFQCAAADISLLVTRALAWQQIAGSE
jgi:hypothetical protein